MPCQFERSAACHAERVSALLTARAPRSGVMQASSVRASAGATSSRHARSYLSSVVGEPLTFARHAA